MYLSIMLNDEHQIMFSGFYSENNNFSIWQCPSLSLACLPISPCSNPKTQPSYNYLSLLWDPGVGNKTATTSVVSTTGSPVFPILSPLSTSLRMEFIDFRPGSL